MAGAGQEREVSDEDWEEDDYFDDGAMDIMDEELEELQEMEQIEELEAKQVAWRQQVAMAMESGDPVNGLPQGLRMRVGEQETRDEEAVSPSATKLAPQPVAATRWEFWLLALVCLVSFCTTLHFTWNHLLAGPTREVGTGTGGPSGPPCRQCKAEWWQDFWQWRLQELEGQGRSEPPRGMQWEWGDSANNTDWYQSSAEFVDELVRPFADPGLGPVLHLGCGDAPVPELLLRAGFPNSMHIDIAPQVIEVMRRRYPVKEFPGKAPTRRINMGPLQSQPMQATCLSCLDMANLSACVGRDPLRTEALQTVEVPQKLGNSWPLPC